MAYSFVDGTQQQKGKHHDQAHFLRRRHRNAAIAEFHKWARRKLRADLHGWRLQAQKAKLKALIAATRLGLCDWDNALDTFASFYEPELAPVFRNRVRIRQY